MTASVTSPVVDTADRDADIDRWRTVAGNVSDPEIPVLTLQDLGILRDLTVGTAEGADTLLVTLTPTYTGCPATAVIAADVEAALRAAGADRVQVRTVLAPAWTTDWISADGRRKLREYGIAPPGQCGSGSGSGSGSGTGSGSGSGSRPAGSSRSTVGLSLSVRCPRCGSGRTREVSRFGSTPCKSHWTCLACLEPFDHFKAI
ncbi:MAG TPA: 1,2-phenylacetyl-CoA epoxidase subunit PaaD [Nakamurella sp.]